MTNKQFTGIRGLKTICNKTLWFKNSRFRECLMEISLLCQETSFGTFADNIDALNVLLKSNSHSVLELMENGFNTNKFTERIKNIDWA